MIGTYSSPQAFRRALEDRRKSTSLRDGTDLMRLRRRVAFERLLARLFAHPEPPWLLKGGFALELRFACSARSTVDLDLSVPAPLPLQLAATTERSPQRLVPLFDSLQRAAGVDLQDGFSFLLHQPTRELMGAPGGGFRSSVVARLAGRTFAQFHLDVGLGDALVGQPDLLEGGQLLAFAGLSPVRVAAVPVAQQFAEKIHAYTRQWADRENTRVKDLVDLVLLIQSGLLQSEQAIRALQVTFSSRGQPIPQSPLPRPPLAWAAPYAALAAELDLPTRTLDQAYLYLVAYWTQLRLPA